MDSSTGKKIGIAALIGYAAFWVYNNVFKAGDRLLFGAVKLSDVKFSGGVLVIPMPLSNVGQLPLKMTGMDAKLVLQNGKVIGTAQITQAITFAPNTTQVLNVNIGFDWIALGVTLGTTVVQLIKGGKISDALTPYKPRLQGKLFTPAFTQDFNEPLA